MELVRDRAAAKSLCRAWTAAGETLGLVPTMGALHEGHASLIRRSVADSDRTVVSIFVNPTQFAPTEDYGSYPRDLERDCALCESLGADAVFAPAPSEMYADHMTWISQDTLTEHLEGASRPSHFRGVLTVVTKLLNIVRPDRAYFGEKDAQQLAVVTKMAADLDFDTEIVGCPIARDSDGLALSSRNRRLSADERRAAPVVPRSLECGRRAISPGCASADVERAISEVLASEPLASVDYVSVSDAASLRPVERVDDAVLVSIAVRIGSVRLLDNFSYDPADPAGGPDPAAAPSPAAAPGPAAATDSAAPAAPEGD